MQSKPTRPAALPLPLWLIGGALLLVVVAPACDGRRARPVPDAGAPVTDAPVTRSDAPPASPDAPPEGPSSLSLVSGDHQLVLSLNPGAAPLVVRALDGWGRPVRGAAIVFSVESGALELAETEVRTDADGYASTTFTGGNVTEHSWLVGGVKAQWREGAAEVSFQITTAYFDRLTRYAPAAVLLEPASRNFGVVHTGDVVSGLLQLNVTHTDGPEAHMPIPGIGLRIVPDEGSPLEVRCVDGEAVSDSGGMVGCDVAFAGPVGEHRFTVRVGELIEFHGMTVFIDPS
jgi:hypothetical protein